MIETNFKRVSKFKKEDKKFDNRDLQSCFEAESDKRRPDLQISQIKLDKAESFKT